MYRIYIDTSFYLWKNNLARNSSSGTSGRIWYRKWRQCTAVWLLYVNLGNFKMCCYILRNFFHRNTKSVLFSCKMYMLYELLQFLLSSLYAGRNATWSVDLTNFIKFSYKATNMHAQHVYFRSCVYRALDWNLWLDIWHPVDPPWFCNQSQCIHSQTPSDGKENWENFSPAKPHVRGAAKTYGVLEICSFFKRVIKEIF